MDIKIGISGCLLGEKIRFDGGHKHDHFITDTMGKFVSFVSICPEVESGMGIPREAVRLVSLNNSLRMLGTKSKTDHTDSMIAWSNKRLKEIAVLDLSGYILKKNSPSCGMTRVKVYDSTGIPAKTDSGIFAGLLLQQFPLLPVEEDGRLNDPWLRENFLERVFAYQRLKTFFAGKWTLGNLVEFHSHEKLLLLAHHRTSYTTLGQLVATAKTLPRQELATRYQETFMRALKHLATTKKNVDVLTHMAGYFKKRLDSEQRSELRETIEDYRKGLVPLIVPLTLLRHHVRMGKVEYLAGQSYLEPHPKELMLRNHV